MNGVYPLPIPLHFKTLFGVSVAVKITQVLLTRSQKIRFSKYVDRLEVRLKWELYLCADSPPLSKKLEAIRRSNEVTRLWPSLSDTDKNASEGATFGIYTMLDD